MIRLLLASFIALLPLVSQATQVRFITSLGDIDVALYDQQAPETVKNFLAYQADGSYKNSLFHRVIAGFMVQGGGFSTDYARLPTYASITNESRNGKLNRRGTIAMARTQAPHSASRQFFFNLANNNFLDGSSSKWGYAVFGEITKGIEVIDAIAKVSTGFNPQLRANDVPKTAVVLRDVILIKP
jgi:cyclophilin family peptidyl-prolyl cis-trans isomerase